MSVYSRRVITDDSDDDAVSNASTSFSAATTRPYNCSTCGGNHPCHKCPLKALQVQFEEDTASLFKSNKIPGSITLEASIDGKPFTIKAKLTHSRFTDLCTDLDAHVLESIKFHVASSVKKTSIRRSAAEAELAAKMQALEAKKRKRDAEDFEALQELRREAALCGDDIETSGTEAAAPTAPSTSWFSWRRQTVDA
jgi:hypothetical protein